MPQGVGYNVNPALNPQSNRAQNTSNNQAVVEQNQQRQVQQQTELQSEAGRREQQRRDENLNSDSQPRNEVQAPDVQAIEQLQANEANRRAQYENANGLGQTALKSYGNVQVSEQNQSIADKIKVDITA